MRKRNELAAMNTSGRYAQTLAVLMLVLMVTGLPACSTLGGGTPQPTRYTLDTGPAPATDRASVVARSGGYALALRPVSAPGWLESKRMLYRLDYANDAELAAYIQSSWADTPARLVGDNLNDALSESGLFTAVLGAAPGHADLALQIELSDFSQHFTAANSSRGRISAQATLLRADNGQVIAQKRFETSVTATDADAAGGVNALISADTQWNADIVRWLADTLARCGSVCPSPN